VGNIPGISFEACGKFPQNSRNNFIRISLLAKDSPSISILLLGEQAKRSRWEAKRREANPQNK
jgi:hypothetical protein